MKRILLSLLFSAVFITFYVSIIIIIKVVFDIGDETTKPFAIPMRLPSYLYYDVLNLQNNDDNVLEGVFLVSLAIVFNVVMYAPIFYLVLTLFSKRNPKVEKSEFPPEPPNFET